MKNLEHLPEKFAFKLDEIGKRWIRETFGTDYYDETHYTYFQYPNQTDGKGFKLGCHGDIEPGNKHTLIPTSQLFPTIEKGVMMLVWDVHEESAWKSEVVFYDGAYFVCKSSFDGSYFCVKNIKPIPQIPEYTIEELKNIVGHEFKIKQ